MAKTAQQILYEKRIREEEERRKKEEEERKKQATRITVSTAGKSAQQILYEQRIANAEAAKLSQQSKATSTAVADRPKDNGGFLGGLGYIGQSFLNGAVRGVEGIVDYTVGGLASIFGGDAGKEWAEELMTEDWYNYNAAAEKFNPSGGWQLAGDVVGGVGQGVLAIGAGLAATLATGGGAAPAIIGAGIGGLSAAGTAVSDAVKDPNADKQGLDYTDWLYGTGAGALEAGIEAATGGVGKVTNKLFGKTLGEMGSEIAEAITKKAVKNTVTSSFSKELVKEMAGEGLEEGLSAFLEPYIKQATYDKDAENASLGDIAYSALVGALAGGATSGAVSLTTSSINNADTLKRGSDIAKDSKKTADLLKNAEVISGYESERETGSEIFEAVVKQYEKVKNSLAGTGGAAQTNEQKKMLGELDRYVSAAVMQPAIVNAAKGVALNADSYAESLNAFYQKTNAGRTVTAADLTAGLKMDGTSKEFVNSVNRAMRSNTVLREVVVNNTLGRMEMDAQAYADSIYGDTRISAIATQENINRFVESADADTLSGVNKALGVDVRTATPEIVAAAVKQFRDSGNAAVYEEGYRDVLEAKKVQNAERRAQSAVFEGSGDVEADTRTGYSDIETLERMLEGSDGGTQSAAGDLTDADGTSGRRPLQEGATRFKSGESDIAVIKHGDRYRIYDYKTGKITRSLTVSELRDIVGRMRGGERPAIEVIGRLLDTSSVGDADTFRHGVPRSEQRELWGFRARGRLETAEIKRLAEEKIPEYKGLVETERESVRETVRRAMLNGVSEEDAVLFGRIAAKSGMHIVVDTSGRDVEAPSPTTETTNDAWYDGRNTVYVNADADRSRTFSGLLGHEMWHRMFKAKKAQKLFVRAFNDMPDTKKQGVIKEYVAEGKKRGLKVSDSVNIANEEVAAAYAEEIFNSPDVWEFVLSEEQSLKDRVLKFFRGANKKYSFEPGMTKAAKKWLNEYKKLFNEVSAYNKGRSAAENAVASDKVRKIERVGRVVESGESAEFRTQNAELVDESRKAIKKTTQGKFVEDKYYQRQIDKIDELKQGSYITVGEIQFGSALNKIGFPNSVVYFDVSKVIKEMRTRQDIIPSKIIKAIPDVLDNPIVITEYVDKNGMHSANVYGNLYINNSPVVVGVMMAQTQKGNIISKIQTVHPNRNALKEMTDDKILYLSENKKETKSWFQSLGTQMLPLGGNKFGFIRSISQQSQKNNSFDENSSKKVDDGSRSALKKVGASSSEDAKGGEKMPDVLAFDGDVQTLRKSDGRIAEAKAQVYSDRVFAKKVVKDAFSKIRIMKTLSTKDINALSEEMWIVLNKSKNAKQRETAARDVLSKALNYAQNESRTKAVLELGITPEMLVGEAVKEFKDLLNLGKATYKAKVDAKIEEARAKAIADAEKATSRIKKQFDAEAEKLKKKSAKAQKRFDSEVTKLTERAETAEGRAEAKYERATETAKARLEAEYRTDTTFSEASVKKSFDSVEAISKLKKAKREEIARELWLELQMSDDAAVRDTFVLKYAVKLYDEIRRADYDAYDNMTYGERDALKGELEAMMKKLVKSGRASLRSKMEGDIGDRARLEGEVRSSKLSEIYQSLKKIDDVKRERFLAASGYKSDEFKKTIEALTRIDWRGKFSDNVARGEVKKLLDWYTVDNPMFEGFKDGNETISSEFNESIRIRLEMLSEGEGRFTNSELGALAEVIEYFSNLVTNYDRVWLDNKWVSGEETARRFLDINEKQKNKPLPASVRALRNKIFGQQTFGDPLSVMKLADCYEDGLFVTYYSEWQNAEIAAAAEEARILEEYNEFFSKKGNKDYLKRAMKDTIDLHGVEVRKIDYIEYVMTLKRKQAFEGVEYGGIIVTDKNGNDVQIYPLPMIDDGKGYSARLEAAVDAEYKRAVKALSKADLEYMKILERGYELTREAKAIGDVQRLGFVSVVEGYYYPIRRAYTEHLSEFDGAAAATDKFANAGFNKRTKQDSNSALRIGSADDTFHRHVHGISGYVHLSPVMDSFNKVYKLKVLKTNPGIGADVAQLMKLRGATTSLQAAIAQNANTWKNENGKVVGVEYLQEIMLDTMGKTPSGKGDDFAARLRSGYVTFALGANPKVLLTQISSLFASTSVLSKKSHFLGAFNKTKNVDEYSIVAKLRNGTDTVAKAQGVVDNISEKAQFFMKGIEFVDRLVVKRAFAACQAEVARTEGFKIGTEENLKAAGKLLDKVILETQQNSLASSKTAAARRGGALAKTLQMFKSDAVKGSARIIDAWGEAAYLRKELSGKGLSDTERGELKKRLKEANKKLRRSIDSVISGSVYMLIISELFRSFYGKNDEGEEEKEKWKRRGTDLLLNIIGGLPAISAVVEGLTSQFGDIEAMEFSAVNDLLSTAKKIFDYSGDVLSGKADGKDTAKLLENLINGVGQIFGVPVRNIKNFAYGVLRLVDKDAAYAYNAIFKDMSYASDLENAIESGDDDLALTIIELALGERLGSGLSDGAIRELARLAGLGESMLPSAVGDTVTIDGEERELSGSELKAVREIYGEAVERINVFVESDFYEELSDEQKASAVRKIYTLYKDLGYDSVLGTERDKKAMMLSKLVSGDALVMWDACTVLESDKDEDGKTISGSLKKKVIDAIWQLDITDVQKLLLIGMRGYKFENDDISGVSGYAAQMALYKYIESLEGLSDDERLDLFEACGFEIKGGVAQEPTYKASSSGGGSKRVTKIGHVVGGGTMKGTMIGSMMGKDYSKKIVKLGKIVN